MSGSPAGVVPRYIRGSYLAPQEVLLEETRGTRLFYFPGPVVALLLFLFFDYLAESVRDAAIPAVPYLTDALGRLPGIAGYDPGTYLLIVFLVLTMIGLLWFLARYLEWITTAYGVSATRVLVQRGILSRDFDEIPIDQVRGVDVHQTFLQRILGYGTIRVSAEGGSAVGNEDWKGIPKPYRFQRLVEGASQNLRSARGWGLSGPAPPTPSGYLRPPGQL